MTTERPPIIKPWYLVSVFYPKRDGSVVLYEGQNYSEALQAARSFIAKWRNRRRRVEISSATSEDGAWRAFAEMERYPIVFQDVVHMDPFPHASLYDRPIGMTEYQGRLRPTVRCAMCSKVLFPDTTG